MNEYANILDQKMINKQNNSPKEKYAPGTDMQFEQYTAGAICNFSNLYALMCKNQKYIYILNLMSHADLQQHYNLRIISRTPLTN